jgi:hypothetical protein
VSEKRVRSFVLFVLAAVSEAVEVSAARILAAGRQMQFPDLPSERLARNIESDIPVDLLLTTLYI